MKPSLGRKQNILKSQRTNYSDHQSKEVIQTQSKNVFKKDQEMLKQRDFEEQINNKISQGMKNVMQIMVQKLVTLVDERVGSCFEKFVNEQNECFALSTQIGEIFKIVELHTE